MSDDTLAIRASAMYVDVTPGGEVAFSNIAQDDTLDSTVIYLQPATAYKLAQMLISAAESIELP